ncbi:MAG: AMP-binding protein [Caldilineaceae bacterium]
MFAHLARQLFRSAGVPVAGMGLKLVQTEEKLEVRYRGPNVTPGYWRQPELNATCFDAEGFFRTGMRQACR